MAFVCVMTIIGHNLSNKLDSEQDMLQDVRSSSYDHTFFRGITMLKTRLSRSVALIFVLAAGVFAGAAEPTISASLVATEVRVTNGIADATFRIEVTNGQATALSNVWVVFADNIELAIADVPAEGSASSEPITKTFDVSQSPSAYSSIPVTLKYTVDGVQKEAPETVLLRAEQ